MGFTKREVIGIALEIIGAMVLIKIFGFLIGLIVFSIVFWLMRAYESFSKKDFISDRASTNA